MDALAAGSILIALLLFAAAATAPAIYASWRRAMTDEGPLPIGAMMARQGVSADDATGLELELALAARRCAGCFSVEECRRWLESGEGEDWKEFCPNSGFIGRLKAGK